MKKIILETVKTLDGSACLQYTFKEAAADRVSLDMLINADIRGFIKPECSRYDSEILLRWQIGRLTPLKDYLSVGKRGDLYNLLRSLCSALLSADNFFLESNPILFDPDFIFYDPSKRSSVRNGESIAPGGNSVNRFLAFLCKFLSDIFGIYE